MINVVNFEVLFMKNINKLCPMVLISGGYSEKSAQVRNSLCYLTCSRCFIKSRGVTNKVFSIQKDLFSCIRAQHIITLSSKYPVAHKYTPSNLYFHLRHMYFLSKSNAMFRSEYPKYFSTVFTFMTWINCRLFARKQFWY